MKLLNELSVCPDTNFKRFSYMVNLTNCIIEVVNNRNRTTMILSSSQGLSINKENQTILIKEGSVVLYDTREKIFTFEFMNNRKTIMDWFHFLLDKDYVTLEQILSYNSLLIED